MIGRLRILPCLVALAALGTACGGASSRSAGTAATSAAGVSSPVAVAALASVHGACMQTTWKSQMQLEVGLAGQNATLTADALADPHPDQLAADMTTSTGLEMKALNGVEYLRQGDTKWSRISLATVPVAQQRPPCGEFLVLTGTGITNAQEAGDQTAGSAHHYRFQADAYTLLGGALLMSPQSLAFFQQHPVQISADLYTDASGRPLRYGTDTADTNADNGGVVSLKLTETYSDFGTPVRVTAPDPSQVTDKVPAELTQVAPPGAGGA